MEDSVRRDLGQRLNRIEGQARGIRKMLDEGQDASAILIQLMAIQKAARAAAATLVKAQATARIRTQLRVALEACPGPCDHCEELAAVEQALSDLDLEALLELQLKVAE